MPTLEQIRAARALLDWSQSDLAERAGLSQTGIARIENGTNKPNSSTLAKIEAAFDAADVEFIGRSGVNKRVSEIRTLKGVHAMSDFLDDVYKTALAHGTKEHPVEIFLSNVFHQNWIKWMGSDRWENHVKRMVKIKDITDVRIIVKEDDTNLPASTYSQYKWMPEELFNDQSFYSYHDKLAFLNFTENDLTIFILRHYDFSKGYRDLFRIAWDRLPTTQNMKTLTTLEN